MGETVYLIAQASSDENQNITGGNKGDQKGFELNARQWYSCPWDVVYRAVDEDAREKIADFMEKAVVNGFIGYDQSNRSSLYNRLNENGYKIDELTTICECDCSSLTYCALYPVTKVAFVNASDASNIIPTTSYYQDYLENQCAGMFTKLEGADYTDSSDNLIRGDILLRIGEHVAVWI